MGIEEQLTFGVGCFDFASMRPAGEKVELRSHIAGIHSALSSINNISSIHIDENDDPLFEAPEIPESRRTLREGGDPLGSATYRRIKFEVIIPTRLQEQVLEPLGWSHLNSQRFSIEMLSPYFMPVAYVTPLDSPEPDPALAVVLVRRFLEREFEKMSQRTIAFDFLGPTPFHGEFFILPIKDATSELASLFGHDQETKMLVDRMKTTHYDRFEIVYDPSHYGEVWDVFAEVRRKMSEELGLFYRIKMFDSQKQLRWTDLSTRSDRLVEELNQRGLTGIWRRLVRARHELSEVMLEVANLESDVVHWNQHLRRGHRTLSESAFPGWLSGPIEGAFESSFEMPTQHLNSTLQLLEVHRVRTSQSTQLLISSLMGGAVGSLLTALLTNPS